MEKNGVESFILFLVCAEINCNRGLANSKMGNFNRAIVDFDQVITDYDRATVVHPLNEDAFCFRGDCLSMIGEKRKAISDLMTALEMGLPTE